MGAYKVGDFLERVVKIVGEKDRKYFYEVVRKYNTMNGRAYDLRAKGRKFIYNVMEKEMKHNNYKVVTNIAR